MIIKGEDRGIAPTRPSSSLSRGHSCVPGCLITDDTPHEPLGGRTQNEATSPAQNEATSPAQNEATSPAQNEATSPAQNEATSPAQNEATSPAQNEATSPAQKEAIGVGPAAVGGLEDDRGGIPMLEVLGPLVAALESGRAVAFCQVVATRGSTPQKAGAMMLLDPDGGQVGTLGGGCVEAEVKRKVAGADRPRGVGAAPVRPRPRPGVGRRPDLRRPDGDPRRLPGRARPARLLSGLSRADRGGVGADRGHRARPAAARRVARRSVPLRRLRSARGLPGPLGRGRLRTSRRASGRSRDGRGRRSPAAGPISRRP